MCVCVGGVYTIACASVFMCSSPYLCLLLMFHCIQEYHTRQLDLTEPPDGFNSTRGVKETAVTASEFKVCVCGGVFVCGWVWVWMCGCIGVSMRCTHVSLVCTLCTLSRIHLVCTYSTPGIHTQYIRTYVLYIRCTHAVHTHTRYCLECTSTVTSSPVLTQDDEYVVYTPHQQRIRYLVEFQLGGEQVDPVSGVSEPTTNDIVTQSETDTSDSEQEDIFGGGAAASGESGRVVCEGTFDGIHSNPKVLSCDTFV